MANKVPSTPMLPTSLGSPTGANISLWAGALVRSLFQVLGEHAFRLNEAVQLDGTDTMEAPLPMLSIVADDLPTTYPPAEWAGAIVFVPDETGGPTLAFSDGTNWVRVQDLATVTD